MKTSRPVHITSILFLIAVAALRLDAQEVAGNAEAYFKLAFSGKSEEIAKLLAKQPKRGARNIVFLISPMTCPRCEGLAYELMARSEKENRNGANFCVVSYPRLASVFEYVKLRKFPVRTILDTSGSLFREIGLAKAPPFLTVWDSTGTLLYAKALYGVDASDTAMWRDIRGGTIAAPSAPVHRTATTIGMEAMPESWLTPPLSFRTVLQEDSTSVLASVSDPAVDLSRNVVAMMDNLTLTIKLFDLKSGKLLHTLTPDYALRKMFSEDIGRSEFLNLERVGVAHTMFFGSFFSGDTVFVSATLPQFREHYVDRPDGRSGVELGYYNVAAIVGYSIKTGERLTVTRIDAMVDSNLAVTHTSPAPVYNRRRGEIAMVVGKGYPYTGTSTASAMGKGNPTRREFYNDAPLFMTFNAKTGKYVRRLGSLDTINHALGVGYALASARIAVDGDRYYMVQNPRAVVTASNGKSITLKSYFNPSITGKGDSHGKIPSIDEMAHLADSTGARISKIAAHKGKLYVLWHIKRKGIPYSEGYYLLMQQYSTSDGTLQQEWNIPQTTGDGKLSDLAIDPAAGVVVCLYQTAMHTTAVGYKLKDDGKKIGDARRIRN